MLNLYDESFLDTYREIYRRSREATVFHSPEWLKVLRDYYGAKIFFVEYKGAVMPILKVGKIRRGYHSLPLDTFGGFIGGEVEVPVESIYGLFARGDVTIVDYLGTLHGDDAILLETYRVHLDRTYEEIFSGYSPSHRRDIRKAKKTDLREVKGDLLDEFYYLYKELSKFKPIGIFDRRFFELVHGYMYPHSALFHLIYDGDKPVSASLVLYNQNMAVGYQMGYRASPPEGAVKLMVDFIIRDLKEKGLKYFDLGITPRSAPGVAKFKRGFGAVPYRFRKYERLGTGTKIIALLTKVWRNLF